MTADADVFRSDALASMTAHLTGPLAAGARHTPIALDADGAGVIGIQTRHPLLLVVLQADLGAAPLEVDVAVGGAAAVRLTFAPYSERGAALGLPIAPAAPPIALVVTPAAGLDVRLVDGVLGRLLYTLGAEKARLRRSAREIAAGRRLAAARGAGLDRLGVELRVPRFRAELAWSAAENTIIATPGAEADAPYRDRLALFRPQVRPTRPELEAALPEVMARVGYTGTLAIFEPDTELAIAIKVVSPPDDSRRLAHLAYVRRQFLLPIGAAELPPDRLVSVGERTRARELLARLATETTWPAGAHVAPSLAAALSRVARCAAALGVGDPIEVTRAQRDDGGSRYELGIGVDVRSFTQAEVQQMVTALRSGTLTGDPDAETRRLLAKMTPADLADDRAPRWLYGGCGLRTVQFVAANTHYLSHLPIHGATLDVTAAGDVLDLRAVLRAQVNPELDANLAGVLGAALDGVPAWTATPASVLSSATVPPEPALAAFRAAELVTPAAAPAVADAMTAIAALPAELFAVLRADDALAAALLAGDAGATAALGAFVARLRVAGAVSLMPVVAASAVVLVVAMIDLPANAAVFNRRRSRFRWIAAPLEADTLIGSLERTQGARNRYRYLGPTSASQVAAIIAMTPTRPVPLALHERVEPYTFAVDLADDSQPLLSFTQYEYLMNVLDRWCPLGVTIDTSRLRTRRVDVDGDGAPDLLSLRLQQTFRPFRGRRPLGARS